MGQLSVDDARHGTENGYKNHGCRCPRCRHANNVAHRDYMHRSGRAKGWNKMPDERFSEADCALLREQVEVVAEPLTMYALIWLMTER